MIIHCWNVRGLNSPLKQHEKFRLKRWKFLTNVVASSATRIVIFWNPSIVKVDFVDSSAQGVHVVISSLMSQVSFHVTFVYGLHTIVDRRDLWDSLCLWGPSDPWLVLGNFNSILSQDDKLNGNVVSMYEINDFHNCCHDLGLFDLNYSGCHFTWSNGHVWSKIDSFLVNPIWSSLQHTHVHFGNHGAFSDHSPTMVRLDHKDKGRRSFKLFNMWTSHVDFLNTVSESWHLDVVGSPMFSLCRKFKVLKNPLKHLNQLHFSQISENVKR
ncbi:hypothetical protein OIU76_021549 [Salix suchowensis]|nr:hypothetical protein OIU76_021549 [Salix suchowensis]